MASETPFFWLLLPLASATASALSRGHIIILSYHIMIGALFPRLLLLLLLLLICEPPRRRLNGIELDLALVGLFAAPATLNADRARQDDDFKFRPVAVECERSANIPAGECLSGQMSRTFDRRGTDLRPLRVGFFLGLNWSEGSDRFAGVGGGAGYYVGCFD